MGDAQSAQREGMEDAVVDEVVVKVDDAHKEKTIEDELLQNNGQISGLNEKADEPIAEGSGHCEDKVVAEVCEISKAIVSPKEDVPETTEPLKEEETLLENVDINEKVSPDSDEATPPNMSETQAKLNEINEGFKTFFSNIGLKLTVKKDSGEKAGIASDVPTETKEGEPSSLDDIKDITKETTSDNVEQNIDLNTAQETPDNDSTTCPTMTDMTSEDIQVNAEEKDMEMTDAIEEVTPDTVVEAPTSTAVGEEEMTAGKDTAPETTSPTSPGEEVMSPIKKFFTTGIFSGLRKKKKLTEQEAKDKTTEKELVDMGKHEDVTKAEEAGQDQEQMKEEISPGVETTAVEGEQNDIELKVEITPTTPEAAVTIEAPDNAPEGTSAHEGPSTAIVNEAEILNSQERVKVQGSPLKRLLSGSSLKKLSKKQRARRSSDSKLTDSGEHASDHLLSSTESAEGQRVESPVHSPEEVTQQEDGTWASFKKRVTPKKRPKRSSLSNEEVVISSPPDEPKSSEGEQISDLSTEETKKKMDSSVSWEAFLCGSGKRKGRKTSDSEDETPGEPKHAVESPLESSQEGDEHIASSPERTGSPSEGDGASTWKSLKRLVTPKRKAKDEEESKDHIPSDTESIKDESSFSIKNLLPGRKKRKSADKQDQISSDEADRGVGSDEEDSETPAVVPLSEFDTFETEDHIQTQAVVESHIPKAEEAEPQQDQVSEQATEAVLLNESLPAESEKVQDTSKELASSAVHTSDEDFEDLTELISKHQQLSDIPEEGNIEESMATPGSVAEEAARDDTMAEDLIELTSDAVTALEPVDATLADETTEMVSAVSQLTESSKTSGNTTPVPAEYDEKETEALLHQVCETISVTPNAVSVCTEDVSVSRQILETSTQQEATILQAHRKSDATALCIGLDAKDFDAVEEVAATTKAESVSEVSEAVSTELAPEDTTEEFETAGIATAEVHQAISDALASAEELDTIDESQPLVECVSEANEAISAELLPVDERLDSAGISIDSVNQAEIQSTEMESPQVDSTAVIGETENEAVAQMDQAEEEKDHIIDNRIGDIPEHTQAEDEDQIVEVLIELQALTAVHVAASNSEEGGAQVLEKQVISEDFPAPEADKAIASVTDEPMQGAHLTEVNVEGEKEDQLPAVEVDAAEVEHAPVPDAMARGLKDTTADVVHDLQPCTAVPVVTPDLEEGTVDTLEKEAVQKDIPAPDTDNVSTSVTDEHMEEAGEVPQHVEVADEDKTADVVNELEALTAVHVKVVNSEAGSAQVLEKQVISEHVPEPDIDTASTSVTEEHIKKSHLSVEGEKEAEFPGVEIIAAEVEHVLVAQIIASNVKDVTTSIPDAAVVEALDVSEPVVPVVTTELEAPEAIESVRALTPILNDDMIETAEAGDVVVMQPVLAVMSEDHHEIKVQVVDVDIKSAETIVETMLDVGVTGTTEVIDVCDKMDNEVENLSASLEIEEEIIDEAHKVMTQEVTPHEKENLPVELHEPVVAEAESCVENEPVILEQELVMLPAVILQSSEIAEDELSEVEVQKVPKDSSETLSEKQPEGPADISVEPVQEESENMATPHVPETLADVSIHECKEHLEEAKVELKKVSEIIEDSTCPSQAFVLEKLKEDVEEQRTQATSYQVMKPSNTGLVSQNTGLVSSVGNVESPASLSLEFKLNIHFGQTMVTASSPPMITRTETLKQTEVTEAGVQVTEKEEPITQIKIQEKAEILKQPELSEIGVQANEVVESLTKTVKIERAETAKQPEVSEAGIQATEAVEPVRGTETTDSAETQKQSEPSEVHVQAVEAIETVKQIEIGLIEKPAVLNQPVQVEVCVQATETMELVKKTEEENDQDVWQDAEENVYIQEGIGKSWIKAVESVESQKENYQPKKGILEHEMAHHSHIQGEGESQLDVPKEATGKRDVESAVEDFAVALEPPETQTAVETTITTLEWD